MKIIKLLLLCILVMALATGCGKEATSEKDIPVDKKKDEMIQVSDELFENVVSGAEFVAVKMMERDYVPTEEDDGTYYRYYRIIDNQLHGIWWSAQDIELPVGLQPGEFAYVLADTTFITGGYDGRMRVDFKEIKECKKISLEEAESLIEIPDLYECERAFFYGFGELGIHSKVNGLMLQGTLSNRLDYSGGTLNSLYGSVTAYLNSEIVGQFNRLELVGGYFVLFRDEKDEEDTALPEYISAEKVEELLATGKQYNEDMFVLHKQEESSKVFTRFILGDKSFLAEAQEDKWYIPDFPEVVMGYEYTYLDLDGDNMEEMLIQSTDGPEVYNGVFHYEEGRLVCWNSDAEDPACRDYPLQDGTMVRQYDYNGTRSYALFRYNSDGTREDISTIFARDERIPANSTEKCPYYEIDGTELELSEFIKTLNTLVFDKKLESEAWYLNLY